MLCCLLVVLLVATAYSSTVPYRHCVDRSIDRSSCLRSTRFKTRTTYWKRISYKTSLIIIYLSDKTCTVIVIPFLFFQTPKNATNT